MSGTAADVIRVAKSFLGTTDGAQFFAVFGEPDYGPYCVAYVRAVMKLAGVDFPWHTWYAWDWHDAPNPIAPKDFRQADGVSFDWDGDTSGDHVGIFDQFETRDGVEGFWSYEGNTSGGKVDYKWRPLSCAICGIRPTYRHAEQDAGEPKNDVGIHYRAHTQDAGWLAPVHDGQVAGITGESLRMEAVKVTPPAGVVLDVFAHVQDIGTLGYPNIRRGESSGTGSSDNDPIIGTVGRSKRLEAVMVRVVQDSIATKGHPLRVQAHVQDIGWMEPAGAGEWAGTLGESKRLEALRIWFE